MEGNEAMKMKGEGTGMDNVIQRERESKSIFFFFFPAVPQIDFYCPSKWTTGPSPDHIDLLYKALEWARYL